MRHALSRLAALSIAALAAGCTHVGTTQSTKSPIAPTSLSVVAVEYVTPRFTSANIAATSALVEWKQLSAVARDVTPRVFARAQVAAVLVDENPGAPVDPAAAACRYMLLVTFSQASASVSRGYHNEHARVTLVDRRTRDALWNSDTTMAGGASGFEAADVDKFLTGVIAAMHKDGIFDNTAAN